MNPLEEKRGRRGSFRGRLKRRNLNHGKKIAGKKEKTIDDFYDEHRKKPRRTLEGGMQKKYKYALYFFKFL